MTREERAYNYASKKNPTKFTVNEIIKHYNDGYNDAINLVCDALQSLIEEWSHNDSSEGKYRLEAYKELLEFIKQ